MTYPNPTKETPGAAAQDPMQLARPTNLLEQRPASLLCRVDLGAAST